MGRMDVETYRGVSFQNVIGNLTLTMDELIFLQHCEEENESKPVSRSWEWDAIETCMAVYAPHDDAPVVGGTPKRMLQVKLAGPNRNLILLHVPESCLSKLMPGMEARLVTSRERRRKEATTARRASENYTAAGRDEKGKSSSKRAAAADEIARHGDRRATIRRRGSSKTRENPEPLKINNERPARRRRCSKIRGTAEPLESHSKSPKRRKSPNPSRAADEPLGNHSERPSRTRAAIEPKTAADEIERHSDRPATRRRGSSKTGEAPEPLMIQRPGRRRKSSKTSEAPEPMGNHSERPIRRKSSMPARAVDKPIGSQSERSARTREAVNPLLGNQSERLPLKRAPQSPRRAANEPLTRGEVPHSPGKAANDPLTRRNAPHSPRKAAKEPLGSHSERPSSEAVELLGNHSERPQRRRSLNATRRAANESLGSHSERPVRTREVKDPLGNQSERFTRRKSPKPKRAGNDHELLGSHSERPVRRKPPKTVRAPDEFGRYSDRPARRLSFPKPASATNKPLGNRSDRPTRRKSPKAARAADELGRNSDRPTRTKRPKGSRDVRESLGSHSERPTTARESRRTKGSANHNISSQKLGRHSDRPFKSRALEHPTLPLEGAARGTKESSNLSDSESSFAADDLPSMAQCQTDAVTTEGRCRMSLPEGILGREMPSNTKVESETPSHTNTKNSALCSEEKEARRHGNEPEKATGTGSSPPKQPDREGRTSFVGRIEDILATSSSTSGDSFANSTNSPEMEQLEKLAEQQEESIEKFLGLVRREVKQPIPNEKEKGADEANEALGTGGIDTGIDDPQLVDKPPIVEVTVHTQQQGFHHWQEVKSEIQRRNSRFTDSQEKMNWVPVAERGRRLRLEQESEQRSFSLPPSLPSTADPRSVKGILRNSDFRPPQKPTRLPSKKPLLYFLRQPPPHAHSLANEEGYGQLKRRSRSQSPNRLRRRRRSSSLEKKPILTRWMKRSSFGRVGKPSLRRTLSDSSLMDCLRSPIADQESGKRAKSVRFAPPDIDFVPSVQEKQLQRETVQERKERMLLQGLKRQKVANEQIEFQRTNRFPIIGTIAGKVPGKISFTEKPDRQDRRIEAMKTGKDSGQIRLKRNDFEIAHRYFGNLTVTALDTGVPLKPLKPRLWRNDPTPAAVLAKMDSNRSLLSRTSMLSRGSSLLSRQSQDTANKLPCTRATKPSSGQLRIIEEVTEGGLLAV